MPGDVEVDLERQVLKPGGKLVGKVLLKGFPHFEWAKACLQGEEVLGANNVGHSAVLPIVEEVKVLAESRSIDQETFPFEFVLPEDAPPSYASREIRCHYFLKVHVRRGGWSRDVIRRFHLTVLPPEASPSRGAPREIVLEEGKVRLVARLDQVGLITGESLSGSLLLDQVEEGAPLPARLTFRFAAIEESTFRGFSHREVLWLTTHDVEPADASQLPISGFFDFPLREDAPFSGTWNTFRLHYGFRVGMYLPGGRNIRESLPIRVYRHYHPLG